MFKSFVHAFSGMKSVFRAERNFRVQTSVGLAVCICGFYVGLAPKEWVVIILVIGLVLLLELLNTVIERMIDVVKPKLHEQVRIIKDVMAAAVLMASFVALLVGIIIFYPYVQHMI